MENIVIDVHGSSESVVKTVEELNSLFEGLPFQAELISTEYTFKGQKVEVNAIWIQCLLDNFYFSFGTAEYFPYQGGYVLVKAHNKQEAVKKYRSEHPDIQEGIINCSFIYTQEEWDQAHAKLPEYIRKEEVCHKVIV